MNNTKEKKIRIEQFVLVLSIATDFLCAVANGVVGIHNDSTAITFDGLYCLVLSVGSIILLIYSRKIDAPPDRVFQFGYSKIEPTLVVTQTLIITFSCIYGLISTLRDIFNQHVINSFLEVTILQLSIAIVSLFVGVVCYYYGKKLVNKILLAQSMIWFLGSMESAMIAFGFSIGYFIQGTRFDWISPYIDPTIMICLVLTIIREPIRTLYINFMELLDASTDEKTAEKIEGSIRPLVNQQLPNLNIRTILERRSGKRLFIILLYERDSDVSVSQIAELRDIIHEKLGVTFGDVDVDVKISV